MRKARLLLLAGLVAAAIVAPAGSEARTERAAATPTRCHMELRTGVLPVWARAGFSGPRPRIPHVLGRSGRIAAILFGYPLRSPTAPGRNNKILWVSRTLPGTPAALWIKAQRMGGRRRSAPQWVASCVAGQDRRSWTCPLPAAGV
jgi:hypothetical protein